MNSFHETDGSELAAHIWNQEWIHVALHKLELQRFFYFSGDYCYAIAIELIEI